MTGSKPPKFRTLESAQLKVDQLHRALQKHPAARANRLVHLALFAAGGTVLVLAAVGLTFGEGGSTTLQILVGILLVAPETIGVAGATEAAKSFASSMGGAFGKIASGKKD